jgi:hypothetical protein
LGNRPSTVGDPAPPFPSLAPAPLSPALRTPPAWLRNSLALSSSGLPFRQSSPCASRAPLLPSVRRVPEEAPAMLRSWKVTPRLTGILRSFVLRSARSLCRVKTAGERLNSPRDAFYPDKRREAILTDPRLNNVLKEVRIVSRSVDDCCTIKPGHDRDRVLIHPAYSLRTCPRA